MNTLTWEYLFTVLEANVNSMNSLESIKASGGDDRREMVLGLHAVLPRLHEHPVLYKHIPYMGILTFHWWPTEGCVLTLSTWQSRDKYDIRLTCGNILIAEATVGIDDAIETLLNYFRLASGSIDAN